MEVSQLKSWRWYHNSTMVHLWINLLISARQEDGWYGMKEIKRGQVITSLAKLSADTGISIRKIRTCLSNLSKSGEIEEVTSNQFRIITILNFDNYFGAEQTEEKTKRQASVKQRKHTNRSKTVTYKESKPIANSIVTSRCQANDKQMSDEIVLNDKRLTSITHYPSDDSIKTISINAKQLTKGKKYSEKETKDKKENSPHTPYKEKKEKKEKDSTTTHAQKEIFMSSENLVEELTSDAQWLAAIGQYHSLSQSETFDMIQRFCLHRICCVSVIKSVRDTKKHFDNWLRIQLKSKKQDDERTQKFDKRRGAPARVYTEADYLSSF